MLVSRWDPLLLSMKEFDVGAKMRYKCHLGYWLSPHVQEFVTSCLDNGLWKPNPRNFKCVSLVCDVPKMSDMMVVHFQQSTSSGVCSESSGQDINY